MSTVLRLFALATLLNVLSCAETEVKIQVKMPDAAQSQGLDVDLFVYSPADGRVSCDAIGFGDLSLKDLESRQVLYQRLVQNGQPADAAQEIKLPRQGLKLALVLIGSAEGEKALEPDKAIFADCREFADLVEDGQLVLEPKPTMELLLPDAKHNSLVSIQSSTHSQNNSDGTITLQPWQYQVEQMSTQGVTLAVRDPDLNPGPSRLRLRVLDSQGLLEQQRLVTMNANVLLALPGPDLGPFQLEVRGYFQRGPSSLLPGYAWQSLVDSDAEANLHDFLTSEQEPILWMTPRRSRIVDAASQGALVFARQEEPNYLKLCHIDNLSQGWSGVHCTEQAQLSILAVPLGSMSTTTQTHEHYAEAFWLPALSVDNTGHGTVQIIPDDGVVKDIPVNDEQLQAVGSMFNIGPCEQASPATYLLAFQDVQNNLKYRYMRIDFSFDPGGQLAEFVSRLYTEQESRDLFPNAALGALSGRQCLRDAQGHWQGLLGLRTRNMPFSSVFRFDGSAALPNLDQPLPPFELAGFVPQRIGSNWAVWPNQAASQSSNHALGDALLSTDNNDQGYSIYAFDLLGDQPFHLSSGRVLQHWVFSEAERLESVHIAVARSHAGKPAQLASQFTALRLMGEREATILLSAGAGREDVPQSLAVELLSQSDRDQSSAPPQILFDFAASAASDSSLHLLVAKRNAAMQAHWQLLKISN